MYSILYILSIMRYTLFDARGGLMSDKYLIYNRVKDLRNKNNLTQEQLAELVDVTRLTIISIEKQKYEPSIGLVIRLAKVLGTAIEQLFWMKEEDE